MEPVNADSQDDRIAVDAVRRLLEHMGENPNREGLIDTPRRVLAFYREFGNGKQMPDLRSFSAEGYDTMVRVSEIPFFSLCEHHLVPFFGRATIGYLPDRKIVGLSKLPRLLRYVAERPQNQERITSEVADILMRELQPRGVGVFIRARHLCMEMRGIRSYDTWTETTSLRGLFIDDPAIKSEFLERIT